METHNKELTITRTFNAPIDLVWAAWTDVEHIKNWWGQKDLRIQFACGIVRLAAEFILR